MIAQAVELAATDVQDAQEALASGRLAPADAAFAALVEQRRLADLLALADWFVKGPS